MGAKIGLSKIGLGLDKKRSHISKMSKALKPTKTIKKKKSKKKASKRKSSAVQKSVAFNTIVKAAKSGIKKSKGKSLKNVIIAAIRSAKQMNQNNKIKKVSRILKLPKFGGSLQGILPILTGLNAIGSLTTSAIGIGKTLKAIENAKKQFDVEKANGERKVGNGLSLIYKGFGFYLKPSRKHC